MWYRLSGCQLSRGQSTIEARVWQRGFLVRSCTMERLIKSYYINPWWSDCIFGYLTVFDEFRSCEMAWIEYLMQNCLVQYSVFSCWLTLVMIWYLRTHIKEYVLALIWSSFSGMGASLQLYPPWQSTLYFDYWLLFLCSFNK